jgi:hypothetical protein
MDEIIVSMSLTLPPGVFISITIAAAFWLCAVETTRDMKAAEPASTGKLKSVMTTVFPDVADCADTVAAENGKLPTTSKTRPVTSKPKIIEAQKAFCVNFSIFLLFFVI